MIFGLKTRAGIAAVALGASVLASTAPAEAFFFPRRGGAVVAGLIGGLAFGALAAAAQQAQAAASPVTQPRAYIVPEPARAVAPESSEEVLVAPRHPRVHLRSPARQGSAEESHLNDLSDRPRPTVRPVAAFRLRGPSDRAGPSPKAMSAVRACGATLAASSRRYGGTKATVVGTGPLVRTENGNVTAPIKARLEFARQGGREVRQAGLLCRLNARGQVVALQ
jgi:hypothetical protein